MDFSFDDKTKQGTIIAYVVDSNDNTILEFNSGEGEKILKCLRMIHIRLKLKRKNMVGNFEYHGKRKIVFGLKKASKEYNVFLIIIKSIVYF